MQSGVICTREQHVQEPIIKSKLISKYHPNVKDMNKHKGKTIDMEVGLSKHTTVTFNQDNGNSLDVDKGLAKKSLG